MGTQVLVQHNTGSRSTSKQKGHPKEGPKSGYQTVHGIRVQHQRRRSHNDTKKEDSKRRTQNNRTMATNDTGVSTNTQNTEKKIARDQHKTIEPWQPMTQVFQPIHKTQKRR